MTTAKEKTLDANRYVHSTLVEAGEYERSPHFREENQDQGTRALALKIAEGVPKEGAKAIDFGCGTGFMIDLIKDRFAEVHGVDITPEMMARVDLSSGNVFLHESVAEHVPFADNSFDYATAYSFMDHLHDLGDFLREVHRVLKPGGIFYSGLNPNRGFILAMEAAAKAGADDSAIVTREIQGALRNGEYYAENFGLEGDLVEQAEPLKTEGKGFDAAEVSDIARRIGFSDCRIGYEWFLGQGAVMHGQSFEAADLVDGYLKSVLPVTAPLFKYLDIILTK